MAKSITASVGRMGGINRIPDVKVVQELLNNVPPASGGPAVKLMVNGDCGKDTIDAIQRFQLQHFGWSGADGRVDPDGPTLRKLNEFDAAQSKETSPLRSINFKIREVVQQSVLHPNPTARESTYSMYQIVDRANHQSCYYIEHSLYYDNFHILADFYSVVRATAFAPFQTHHPIAITSFVGRHFLLRYKIPGPPGRETVTLIFGLLEDQPANVRVTWQGFRDENWGYSEVGGTDWVLVEPNPRPFAG